MLPLIENWATLSTTTDNAHALGEMRHALTQAFKSLDAQVQELKVPPAVKVLPNGTLAQRPLSPCLSFRKRPDAQKQVLLAGHMDVVLPPKPLVRKSDKLIGSGVADMKGGLAVILETLTRFEKSDIAESLGWEVFINADEEIGSPGSSRLFPEIAKRHTTCLIFEPTLPDGSLVLQRKGSANFAAIAKGRGAHAGRDFFSGKNAIVILCNFCIELQRLIDKEKDITLNIGTFTGGLSANTVPDCAGCTFNVRAWENMEPLLEAIQQIANEGQIELTELTKRPPKPLDAKNKALFDLLGGKVVAKRSGGVCDGNNFSALGLATLDTLGPIGGNLHTYEEYLIIDSLEQKVEQALDLLRLKA